MQKNNPLPVRLYIFLLALPIATGCSFNYEDVEVAEELGHFLPDTILVNFQHTQIKNEKNTVVLKAGNAENYESQHKTILENLYFEEKDNQDELVTEGKADKAIYFNDTENAEISGNINVYSKIEGIKIFADNLIWEKATKQLKTSADSQVVLEKDDGSYVKGTNFSADLRSKEINFKNRVEGSYTQTKNEENNP